MQWGGRYYGMKRLIKKPMGMKRAHFAGFFLVIVCMFLTGFSQVSRPIVDEASHSNGGHSASQEIDENAAEQVWIHCKKELGELTKTISDFDLYSNDNTKRDITSSRKTLAPKAITELPPQLKRSLLLSLKSERSPSRVSSRDGCQEYLSKLHSCNVHHRRTFKIRHHHQRKRRRRPHRSLGTGNASPAPTNSQESSSKRLSIQDSLLMEKRAVPKHHNKLPDHVVLLGIIVSTAVATLALFFLFIICCLGGNEKIGPQSRQEDEKPVVNVCPGRVSGASEMSPAVEGNVDSINSSTMKSFSSNVASQKIGVLPLPPGRAAPPTQPKPQPPPPAAPPPPPKPPAPKAPPPPPPRLPGGGRPPGPPKPGNMERPPGPPLPIGPRNRGPTTSGDEYGRCGSSDSTKTKLKPFFWDKANFNRNRSMVWDELKAGSFQFNEEMMESLFGYAAAQNKNDRGKSGSKTNTKQKFIQIIDPKKAQNLAIVLKALNATTEKVCYALKEGTDLPVELISSLIKMPPTQEEELKLRLYNGDLALLGPADFFLKVLVEIPFVYKRLEALLFMSSLHEDSSPLKLAFATLEVACTKLKNSRLFLKLLEAVLKTGNRMNVGTYRGGAQAIKLDSLLKLSDVKGTDGKTTLLTFVVQEIIRSEGMKAARTKNLQQPMQGSLEYYRKLGLEVVSQLSKELHDVKRAAILDGDHLTSTVLKLGNMLKKTKDLIDNELSTTEEATDFCAAFDGFMQHAEAEITWMFDEEKRIMALVKSTGDYFHGNSAKDEGLRLFVIVRDFLRMLDIVCNDIKKNDEKNSRRNKTPIGKMVPPSQENCQLSWLNVRDKLFPAMKDRKMDYSSSDDEDDSP